MILEVLLSFSNPSRPEVQFDTNLYESLVEIIFKNRRLQKVRMTLELFGSLHSLSDLSVHHVRQAPDSEPVFAVLEVPCIDLFRPIVLDIPEAHGSQISCQQSRVRIMRRGPYAS
jgi:hypothetical protein